MMTEVRTADNSVVAAYCADCGVAVAGRIAVQFIDTKEGRGVQVFVSTGVELHAVARFRCDVIPVVPFTDPVVAPDA